MHVFFRTILTMWRARRRRRRGDIARLFDVSTVRLRTMPSDIDLLGHMNNGMYLSIFDLGRYDQLIRTGHWDDFRTRGWYPVVVNETVSFRKSLNLWQVYDVDTRIVGFDDKAVYVEHRIVVDGEIYTRAIVRARFLKRSGGTVPMPELLAATGLRDGDVEELPSWVSEWAEASALPATRAPAPNHW